jgi:hypothetical protein
MFEKRAFWGFAREKKVLTYHPLGCIGGHRNVGELEKRTTDTLHNNEKFWENRFLDNILKFYIIKVRN